MATHLNPYLSFKDNAREAMTFYQTVFGGDLTLGTFAEMHGSEDPADAEHIMHSQLTNPSGLILMGSDVRNGTRYTMTDAVSVSISGDDETELRGYWDGLTDGATITATFEKAPWGDMFGMCIDKFGVTWLINVALPQ